MKKLKLIIISSLLAIPLCSCKALGNNTIKILNNDKKERWKDTSNDGSILWGWVGNPSSMLSGTSELQYRPQFSNNLASRNSSFNANIANLSDNAYYKFFTFVLGYGGNSLDGLETILNNFVVDEIEPGNTMITDATFSEKFLINPYYQIVISYKPYITYSYYDIADSTFKSRDLTFEDWHALASFKDNFYLNFYGKDSEAATPSGFLRMEYRLDQNIKVTNAFGNLLTGEDFEKARPKDNQGNLLPVNIASDIDFNYYTTELSLDNKRGFQTWGQIFNDSININDVSYTNGVNINNSFIISTDLAKSLLGFDVNRLVNNDGTTSAIEPYNISQMERGSWCGHNQMHITHNIDTVALSNASNYQEGYYHGFKQGQISGQEDWNWTNFLQSIFKSIDTFLNVEILPHIKLWYFIGIPLVFGLLKFILLWFR